MKFQTTAQTDRVAVQVAFGQAGAACRAESATSEENYTNKSKKII
jgi:hypothetical protein